MMSQIDEALIHPFFLFTNNLFLFLLLSYIKNQIGADKIKIKCNCLDCIKQGMFLWCIIFFCEMFYV